MKLTIIVLNKDGGYIGITCDSCCVDGRGKGEIHNKGDSKLLCSLRDIVISDIYPKTSIRVIAHCSKCTT